MLKQKKSENSPPKTNIKKEILIKTKIENLNPFIDVFETIEESLKKLQKDALNKAEKIKFLGPFERYKLVKPFIQAMEEEKEKEKALLAKERKPERVVKGLEGDKISIDVNSSNVTKEKDVERKVTQKGLNISIEVKNDVCSKDGNDGTPENIVSIFICLFNYLFSYFPIMVLCDKGIRI